LKSEVGRPIEELMFGENSSKEGWLTKKPLGKGILQHVHVNAYRNPTVVSEREVNPNPEQP